MSDMIVNLLDIPDVESCMARERALKEEGITIRRAMTPDMYRIVEFVAKTSGPYAKGECTVSLSRQPVSCFIAEKGGELIGYACYEATQRDFFGPMAVSGEYNGRGIGTALLLRCLHDMRNIGYAYAIIGGIGPADFYRKVCGARIIEGSDPGIYKDFLQ